MRLSAKILKNVSGVNHFEYGSTAYISENNVNEIYFQLVDLDKTLDPKNDYSALPNYPLRYMPATGATLSVIFDSLFDDAQFEKAATQPFAQDSSIWKVELAADELPKSGNFIFALTEGSSTKRAVVKGAISVSLEEVGSC